MLNVKDIQIIIENIAKGKYTNTMELPDSKLNVDEDYITDYNKSVIWNRQQAANLKNKYLQYKREYDEVTKSLMLALQKDLFEWVKVTYCFTDSAIYFLIGEAFEQGHSDGMLQVVYILQELCEMCYEFNKLNNNTHN